jgi:hypothetical protein
VSLRRNLPRISNLRATIPWRNCYILQLRPAHTLRPVIFPGKPDSHDLAPLRRGPHFFFLHNPNRFTFKHLYLLLRHYGWQNWCTNSHCNNFSGLWNYNHISLLLACEQGRRWEHSIWSVQTESRATIIYNFRASTLLQEQPCLLFKPLSWTVTFTVLNLEMFTTVNEELRYLLRYENVTTPHLKTYPVKYWHYHDHQINS